MKFEIVDNKVVATGAWAKGRKGALRNSIAKWSAIVAYIEETRDEFPFNGDSSTCNLCHLEKTLFGDTCANCPVYDKTGRSQCHKTPFTRYQDADTHEKALLAARAEVKFLEELYAAEE